MRTEKQSDTSSAKAATSNQNDLSLTFFLGMAVYLTFIVLGGFWQSYFGDLFSGGGFTRSGFLEITWKTHVHAFFFIGWMGLLIYQTLLVSRNQTGTHMKVGKFGFTYGMLVALLGMAMVALILHTGITQGKFTLSMIFPGFLLHPSVVSITEFILLLGLGYAYRSAPETHKRYMLFATIALGNAAAGRYGRIIGEWTGSLTFDLVMLAMVMPIWIYDLRKTKGIHKATVIGTLIISLLSLKRFII